MTLVWCAWKTVPMFVVSCCGTWIYPHCLDRCIKEYERCPLCRRRTREACTVQTRKVYERLLGELGSDMTGRVHQDVFGHFSLEYGLLRMSCQCFCNERALIRLRFECGLNDFVTVMKAIKCIHILPLNASYWMSHPSFHCKEFGVDSPPFWTIL